MSPADKTSSGEKKAAPGLYVALSGGGAHAAAHAGVLLGLELSLGQGLPGQVAGGGHGPAQLRDRARRGHPEVRHGMAVRAERHEVRDGIKIVGTAQL